MYPRRVASSRPSATSAISHVDTFNHPMLNVEKALLERLHVPPRPDEYLHHNQRAINRFDSRQLAAPYYILQVADYDVDRVTPFRLQQRRSVKQGQRFSAIRYGSQTDLIIPVSEDYELRFVQSPGDHVEAGLDPLVAITFTT